MKKSLFMMMVLLLQTISRAQYKPVDQGSMIGFTIANFGFNVNGTFSGVSGDIIFDQQNAAVCKFDVTIDAATVNTDNSLRDKHLKEESYFNATNYPRIRLTSSGIAAKGGGYQFTGKLAIKGKTKDITFPFTATQENDGWIFKGSFTINRKDFDVGGTSTISNELKVNLNVHAVKI